MISGGAELIDTGNNLNGYLTESVPLVAGGSLIGWRVSGRLLPGAGSEGAIRCWGLGLELCPEQWNGDCLSYPTVRSITSAANFGYNTVSSPIPPSFIPVSIGGQALANGADERYLADLIPLDGANRGLTVRSKSGSSANSGATLGAAVVIGRLGAPYNFNAIRFNTAGTSLFRPVAQNGSLQQTNAYPLNQRGRWHLEQVGSNEYRVRNGNPDEGNECAYGAGGNAVRVAACGSGSEFRWRRLPAGGLVFQLQNIASSLCLDNGNQGFTTSALTLETCRSGYSPEQSLFLDAYDWPPESTQELPFRFEQLSDWSSSAPLALNSVLRTDGASGLSVGGGGYRVINSAALQTPVAGFGPTLLLDVYVPGNQPNPYWLGAVQTYATCPSAQLYNEYIGQVELTGLPTKGFSTLAYTLPASVQGALSQAHDDCFLSIAVNTNATPVAPVLDNLRFSP